MDFTYDDTLPPPDEVEREFFDHAGGDVNAWFERHDIAAAPIGGKLIQYGMIWNPCTGRYRFLIYTPDHVGPKYPPELAIPIFEDGVFVDLLFISDEMTFARATTPDEIQAAIAAHKIALDGAVDSALEKILYIGHQENALKAAKAKVRRMRT